MRPEPGGGHFGCSDPFTVPAEPGGPCRRPPCTSVLARAEAVFASRFSASVSRPYRDLAKLLRKGSRVSNQASRAYRCPAGDVCVPSDGVGDCSGQVREIAGQRFTVRACLRELADARICRRSQPALMLIDKSDPGGACARTLQVCTERSGRCVAIATLQATDSAARCQAEIEFTAGRARRAADRGSVLERGSVFKRIWSGQRRCSGGS